MHRLRSDESFISMQAIPVEMLHLHPDGADEPSSSGMTWRKASAAGRG
jgi:hypothetical protein